MERALNYFKDNSPMLESEYPYTSAPKDAPSSDCQYSDSKATNVKVKSLEFIDQSQYKATLQKQPLILVIAANNKYIHSYKSGIIDAQDCAKTVMYDDEDLNAYNHGVLAVGYGTDQATGLDYVLVKNSWNTTWGDQGYFKLNLYLNEYGL